MNFIKKILMSTFLILGLCSIASAWVPQIQTNITVTGTPRTYVAAIYNASTNTVSPLTAHETLGNNNFNPWTVTSAGAYDQTKSGFPLQPYCFTNQIIFQDQTLMISGTINVDSNGKETDNLNCYIIKAKK